MATLDASMSAFDTLHETMNAAEKAIESAVSQVEMLTSVFQKIVNLDTSPATPSTCTHCVDDVKQCYCSYTSDDMAEDDTICRYCGEQSCKCTDYAYKPYMYIRTLPPSNDYILEDRAIVRWKLDATNSCTAIVTKKGLYQVKSVVDGVVNRTKKLFASGDEWKNSLPENGVISVNTRVPRMDEKVHSPLTATSDARKLEELERRFKGGIFFFVVPYYPAIHVKTVYPSDIYVHKEPMIQVNGAVCINTFAEMPVHDENNYGLTVMYRKKTYSVRHLL